LKPAKKSSFFIDLVYTILRIDLLLQSGTKTV
jgi:hypothetical protein